MQSSDIDRWCRRAAQPYLRSHGGAVAAFISGGTVEYREYGRLSRDNASKPDAHTIFEIGSITKVFTSILLCKLALENMVEVDEPVSRALPGFERLPNWITPRALATHTSGLPRIPDGITISDMSNPYREIGEDDLREWVNARKSFAAATPAKMAYSNLGVGLLGLALGKADGRGYREALLENILRPLGLGDTDTIVPEGKLSRGAQPHGSFGRKVPIWDFDALAGCGALKSTVADLALFSQAVISAAKGKEGPLFQAIRNSLTIQIPGSKPFVPDVCFGWLRLKDRETGIGIYHHDGGTGGSSSSLFICPDKDFAILALANTKSGIFTAFRQILADPAGMLGEIVAVKPAS